MQLKGFNANHLGANEAGVLAASIGGSYGASCLYIFKLQGEDLGSGPIRSGDKVVLRSWDGTFFGEAGGRLKVGFPINGPVALTIFREEVYREPLLASTSFLEEPEDQTVNTGDGFYLAGPSGNFVLVDGHTVAVASKEPKRRHRLSAQTMPFGSLHSVTGPDGVYMISALRNGSAPRARRSLASLRLANVFPELVRATEASNAEDGALTLACPLEAEEGVAAWCRDMGREGQAGCATDVEQAIADSHRRALLRARRRSMEGPDWTAILEDDVVPVDDSFDRHFEIAWAAVPAEARIVRLGWCDPEDVGVVEDEELRPGAPEELDSDSPVRLVSKRWFTDEAGELHYHTGGCTSGYLVHREIIEEVLAAFPCCAAFDKCLQRQLFYQPALEPGEWEEPLEGEDFHETMTREVRRWRGSEILVDLDHIEARATSSGFADFNQSGLLVQDHRP